MFSKVTLTARKLIFLFVQFFKHLSSTWLAPNSVWRNQTLCSLWSPTPNSQQSPEVYIIFMLQRRKQRFKPLSNLFTSMHPMADQELNPSLLKPEICASTHWIPRLAHWIPGWLHRLRCCFSDFVRGVHRRSWSRNLSSSTLPQSWDNKWTAAYPTPQIHAHRESSESQISLLDGSGHCMMTELPRGSDTLRTGHLSPRSKLLLQKSLVQPL